MKLLSERDRQSIWHPFTQDATTPLPVPIVKGRGAVLEDEQGKTYLDMISSWWVSIHGHAHPKIAKAIADQAVILEQVIFARFTHEPAVMLAERLLEKLPSTFGKVFFSDNGSVANEIALKMAYQYWRNQGVFDRTRFVALDGGYHGDTFGAMAVGKASGFYKHFEGLMCCVDFLPVPEMWMGRADIEEVEDEALKKAEIYLAEHAHQVAALIVEPLIQGAIGMRMYRPQYLEKLVALAQSHDVLVIFDEVMTGFGRTGSLFACDQIKAIPDFICLSKGLTGGFLPLAVTICHQKIYDAFLGQTAEQAFLHGHSFTANPLGCAAALASLSLFEEGCLERIQDLNAVHLARSPKDKKPRIMGPIAAWTMDPQAARALTTQALEKGLLIRPLGGHVYLLPPYCLTVEELQGVYDVLTFNGLSR